MQKPTERYRFDITCEELDAFKEGECPVNTAKNTEEFRGMENSEKLE